MKFATSAKTLRRIFALWNLPLPGKGLILFAWRGGLPTATRNGWLRNLTLRTVETDYRHLRCTLGIWDRSQDRVFAAPGSTVPFFENVVRAARRPGKYRGKGVNQMEPGFYADLEKGEHLQGKPMGHAALRQTAYRFYRRSPHPPPYSTKDPLYFGNPYDNLHCGWNLDGKEAGFRSSGCLVVSGMPHCPRLPDAGPNQGPWRTFHDFIYGTPQQRFPLLLLPAAEVGKALAETNPKPRLCFGSQGDSVKALQKKLAAKGLYRGRIDGNLSPPVYRAWNRAGFPPPL
jgi:hypothetical protein